MATHAGGLFQDRNLNVQKNVGALIGEKTTNGTSSLKKGGGGLGRRKALNDISNSGKLPSILQASKKHTSTNVVSNEEDFSVSKSDLFLRGKTNAFKDLQKVRAAGGGGRKALGDLTNLGKQPRVHQAAPKSSWNKLSSVAEEHFLHSHKECIEAQKKAINMDMDFFLKTIGLDKDVSMQLPSTTAPSSLKVKFDSPQKSLEMEEMVELLEEVQSPQCAKLEHPRGGEFIPTTPYGGSPRSPKSCLLLEDYKFPQFVLALTP